MQPLSVIKRVERLEKRMDALETLPTRMDTLDHRMGSLEEQISQFRAQVSDDFSATNAQMRVLHEDLVTRISLIQEGSGGPTPGATK